MQTSIIIRVKNEKENLEKLFAILKKQTYQDFEIVVVDNNSTDGSDKIVYDYFPKNRVKISNVKEFSYPKACNLGAERSSGKYLVYLSAHSFPISNTWLADGLSDFKDEKIAGVSSYPHPGKEGSLWERMFFEPPHLLLKLGLKSINIGNTNAIIRRDLWEKHHFDENLRVSEDLEWSLFWKKKGYKIIGDARFSVYHAHKLSLIGLIMQEFGWHKENLKFRNARY